MTVDILFCKVCWYYFQDDFLSTRFARNNRRKSLNIFFGFATDTSSETSVPLSSLSATPNQEGTFTKWKRKIHTKVRFDIIKGSKQKLSWFHIALYPISSKDS